MASKRVAPIVIAAFNRGTLGNASIGVANLKDKKQFYKRGNILERATDFQIPQMKHRDNPNNHKRQNNQ